MSLYQKLVSESKVQENSKILVSEDKLKKFVELIIESSEDNFIQLGYRSGLFDGSGDVDFNSVENFYKRICEEMTKYKKDNGSLLGIENHFGFVIKKANKTKI